MIAIPHYFFLRLILIHSIAAFALKLEHQLPSLLKQIFIPSPALTTVLPRHFGWDPAVHAASVWWGVDRGAHLCRVVRGGASAPPA